LIDSLKREVYILLGMEGVITGLPKKLWFPKLKPKWQTMAAETCHLIKQKTCTNKSWKEATKQSNKL